jgi:hypothetical protein
MCDEFLKKNHISEEDRYIAQWAFYSGYNARLDVQLKELTDMKEMLIDSLTESDLAEMAEDAKMDEGIVWEEENEETI